MIIILIVIRPPPSGRSADPGAPCGGPRAPGGCPYEYT